MDRLETQMLNKARIRGKLREIEGAKVIGNHYSDSGLLNRIYRMFREEELSFPQKQQLIRKINEVMGLEGGDSPEEIQKFEKELQGE